MQHTDSPLSVLERYWLSGIFTQGSSLTCWSCMQDGTGTPGVSAEQIDEIVGQGAQDRGGKGNANLGNGGVAFVLSSSGPSPGGSETVSHTTASPMCMIHEPCLQQVFKL